SPCGRCPFPRLHPWTAAIPRDELGARSCERSVHNPRAFAPGTSMFGRVAVGSLDLIGSPLLRSPLRCSRLALSETSGLLAAGDTSDGLGRSLEPCGIVMEQPGRPDDRKSKGLLSARCKRARRSFAAWGRRARLACCLKQQWQCPDGDQTAHARPD